MPFIARIKHILKKLSCFHDGDEEIAKPLTIVRSFHMKLGTVASIFGDSVLGIPQNEYIDWSSIQMRTPDDLLGI